ncbi:MAG TPA: CAP domain-containing protein [Solirubrobacteraceae bacterium]|nr:CAP domain-containing protein [Solirubrobacteraceae bacterium]
MALSVAGALLAGTIALLIPAQASAVPADRAAALEAYLVMKEATQKPTGWTGSIAGCVVGTESPQSLADSLGALNTIRDFAGLGPATFDPVLNRNALAAALMMHANRRLEHATDPTWSCFTEAGREGARTSNLSFERGAEGMLGDILYDQPEVGHRHALLNPHRNVFGSGSTGGASARVVLGPIATGAIIPDVVAWPPPGNVPWPLAIGTWSAKLSAPGRMDASAAQVQVLINGRAMPVSGVRSIGGSANGLIRWDVAVEAALRNTDAAVEVTISGVKVDGVERPYRYAIRTIRVDTPLNVKFTATRSAGAVTFAWDGAVERGAPVTGYKIRGFAGDFAIVMDHVVSPTARRVTLPDPDPSKILNVGMIPLSRAGSPPPASLLILQPPSPGAVAGGSRAHFVGRVTLRLVRPGHLRAGSRLRVRADVRNERSLRYRWRRNGRSIAGATRSTYRVRRADRGRRISCRVTAVGSDGVLVRKTSSTRLVSRR